MSCSFSVFSVISVAIFYFFAFCFATSRFRVLFSWFTEQRRAV